MALTSWHRVSGQKHVAVSKNGFAWMEMCTVYLRVAEESIVQDSDPRSGEMEGKAFLWKGS